MYKEGREIIIKKNLKSSLQLKKELLLSHANSYYVGCLINDYLLLEYVFKPQFNTRPFSSNIKIKVHCTYTLISTLNASAFDLDGVTFCSEVFYPVGRTEWGLVSLAIIY